MKKHIVCIGIAFLSMLSCNKNNFSEEILIQENSSLTPQASNKTKKVLIIGIDGCRSDALLAANTPNIDALIANGTYSVDARNTGITYSGPGWSAMLTGVWEDKHKVVDNTFSGSDFATYPHFFKRIEEDNPNNRTVSVSQWAPINNMIAAAVADVTRNTISGLDTKNKAVAELAINDLTALFVHFDDVDHAGHDTGFSVTNPNYIGAIENVDNEIGDLIAALYARANFVNEDWVVIVSTDHGGINTGHGGDTDEERTIFLIVSGDSVPNQEIAKTTSEVTVPPADNCLNSITELHFEKDAAITVPNNGAHSFGTSQDFSIECRIRSGIPGDVSIIAKKDWDSGTLPGYVFSFNTSTKKFKVNVGDGNRRVDVETAIITDNEWHTVSATFDRDGMLSVYVDGVFSNAASIKKVRNIDNALPLTIGADGNMGYKYDGYISEVRIFNTLLSGAEINTWKCKVLDNTHPKYASLRGHWKLTEGTGTTITDSSPTGAHGTLSGGTWEDATIDRVITVNNYDNTPRTVDVAKTALNHLCIPIQAAWGMEGNSLVDTDCSTNCDVMVENCAGVTPNLSVVNDFDCQQNYSSVPSVPIIANPYISCANRSSNVGEYTDDGTDAWDNLLIDFGAPIDLSTNNQLKFRVLSNKAVPIIAKMEGGTPIEFSSNITIINEWAEYSFDFSGSVGDNNTKLVLFLNAGKTNGTSQDIYYLDNIRFEAP